MPKKYHFNQAELNWIVQEYNNGRTINENAMLEYLKQNNVTTLQELQLWV